jgi:dolichol-phosphate mannosyltransferase
MLRTLKDGKLDIVVGSRYLDGERTEGLSSDWRRFVSRAGGQVAQLVLHADLTDPMSGFFLMSRAAFDAEAHALSQRGFKILLDIFASAPKPLRFAEVKSNFNARLHGESKLDTLVAWEYGVLVIDKLVGRFLPVRFVVFAAVGLTGVAIHLATFGLLGVLGASFQASQSAAVFVAMTWNFLLNNLITYRDQRLRGAALVRGIIAFYLIGAVGAFANIGIVEMLHGRGTGWWLSGLAGGFIGVVWNYTMSSIFTWRRSSLV